MTPAIRPKAVGAFRRGTQVLVGSAFDSVKNEEFFGLPGGGVEFGETSEQALVREIREELNQEIFDSRLLGVRETVFSYEGSQGHEIVFVYVARFVDESLYSLEEIHGIESGGTAMILRWKELKSFGPGGPPLYPEGLYELLSKGDV